MNAFCSQVWGTNWNSEPPGKDFTHFLIHLQACEKVALSFYLSKVESNELWTQNLGLVNYEACALNWYIRLPPGCMLLPGKWTSAELAKCSFFVVQYEVLLVFRELDTG